MFSLLRQKWIQRSRTFLAWRSDSWSKCSNKFRRSVPCPTNNYESLKQRVSFWVIRLYVAFSYMFAMFCSSSLLFVSSIPPLLCFHSLANFFLLFDLIYCSEKWPMFFDKFFDKCKVMHFGPRNSNHTHYVRHFKHLKKQITRALSSVS